MSYFSRLTDIVTCNLSEILAAESDPGQAIKKIIAEMEEGLAGATRSVKTAAASSERLKGEISEQKSQVEYWTNQAKKHLQAGDESQARLAIIRKREVEDVIAGLEQQQKAAGATREHLSTTLRALEARLAEARRKLHTIESGRSAALSKAATGEQHEASGQYLDDREIDAELEALKRELGQ
ncbi:MAG: PspA/IM30 family protein [Planctomycetaceae bacterium]